MTRTIDTRGPFVGGGQGEALSSDDLEQFNTGACVASDTHRDASGDSARTNDEFAHTHGSADSAMADTFAMAGAVSDARKAEFTRKADDWLWGWRFTKAVKEDLPAIDAFMAAWEERLASGRFASTREILGDILKNGNDGEKLGLVLLGTNNQALNPALLEEEGDLFGPPGIDRLLKTNYSAEKLDNAKRRLQLGDLVAIEEAGSSQRAGKLAGIFDQLELLSGEEGKGEIMNALAALGQSDPSMVEAAAKLEKSFTTETSLLRDVSRFGQGATDPVNMSLMATGFGAASFTTAAAVNLAGKIPLLALAMKQWIIAGAAKILVESGAFTFYDRLLKDGLTTDDVEWDAEGISRDWGDLALRFLAMRLVGVPMGAAKITAEKAGLAQGAGKTVIGAADFASQVGAFYLGGKASYAIGVTENDTTLLGETLGLLQFKIGTYYIAPWIAKQAGKLAATPKPVLRLATEKDADTILKLHNESFTAFPRNEAKVLREIQSGKVVVSETSGVVTGFVNYVEANDGVTINFMAVEKQNRGQGIGAKLLDGLFAAYPDKAFYLKVRVSNKGAIGLYKKMGFETTDVIAGFYDTATGGTEDALQMTRKSTADPVAAEGHKLRALLLHPKSDFWKEIDHYKAYIGRLSEEGAGKQLEVEAAELLRALRDSDKNVRYRAVHALHAVMGSLGNAELVKAAPLLREIWKDPALQIYQGAEQAYDALGELLSKRGADALLQAEAEILRHAYKHSSYQDRALVRYGKMARFLGNAELATAAKELRSLFRGPNSWRASNTYDEIAVGLTQAQLATEAVALRAMIEGVHHEGREDAVSSYGAVAALLTGDGRAEAAQVLRKLLRHSDANIRLVASAGYMGIIDSIKDAELMEDAQNMLAIVNENSGLFYIVKLYGSIAERLLGIKETSALISLRGLFAENRGSHADEAVWQYNNIMNRFADEGDAWLPHERIALLKSASQNDANGRAALIDVYLQIVERLPSSERCRDIFEDLGRFPGVLRGRVLSAMLDNNILPRLLSLDVLPLKAVLAIEAGQGEPGPKKAAAFFLDMLERNPSIARSREYVKIIYEVWSRGLADPRRMEWIYRFQKEASWSKDGARESLRALKGIIVANDDVFDRFVSRADYRLDIAPAWHGGREVAALYGDALNRCRADYFIEKVLGASDDPSATQSVKDSIVKGDPVWEQRQISQLLMAMAGFVDSNGAASLKAFAVELANVNNGRGKARISSLGAERHDEPFLRQWEQEWSSPIDAGEAQANPIAVRKRLYDTMGAQLNQHLFGDRMTSEVVMTTEFETRLFSLMESLEHNVEIRQADVDAVIFLFKMGEAKDIPADRYENLREAMKDLGQLSVQLRMGHRMSGGDLEVVITGDPVEVATAGEEPFRTCQRLSSSSGNNASGEPLNRALHGAFKIAKVVSKDGAVLARRIVEVRIDKNGNEHLLVHRLYAAGGFSEGAELDAKIREYGKGLGIAPERIHFSDDGSAFPPPPNERSSIYYDDFK